MATPQQILDEIDTAILVILQAISAGDSVVRYVIRGREVQRTDPAAALKAMKDLRSEYQEIVNRSSRTPFRPVQLRRPQATDG